MVIWLVASAPSKSTQLVLRPVSSALVCTWSRQPVWSSGQERSNCVPFMTAVILVGLGFSVALTRKVPSVARVLVSQAKPGRGIGGTRLAKAPE